ncbi:exo-beta-N-acetylmuramidase NamZ domain-containing protein [Bacteroidota bacterium]
MLKHIFIPLILITTSCKLHVDSEEIQCGSQRTELYLKKIRNKNVGVIANHSSLLNHVHLTDSLLKLGITITKIFTPEHGFRGHNDAGELINDSKDKKTGIPIISLYGSKRKPHKSDLNNIDILIFDIQDVGVRFFTYLSTLHYVMEACAEEGIPLLILDRPNPNGFYVDGPIMQEKHMSFIGMHPVPIVHGMTIGEYALMINGEKWLANEVQCEIEIIKCYPYHHQTRFNLPVKPSPNLPDIQSVYLYPSTALFEGTVVSEGRGTDKPFQYIGHPDYPDTSFSFIPRSIQGASKNPKFRNQKCYGINLSTYDTNKIHSIELKWLVNFYHQLSNKNEFFNSYFEKLAGTEELRRQIEKGMSIDDIRNSWENGLKTFKKIRKKYLLYPD